MKTSQISNDGISTAFEIIMDEIETEASKIAEKGSEAFKNKDYDEAQKLGDIGKGLMDFRKKVDDLLSDWQAGIDVSYRKTFTIKGLPEAKNSVRKKATKLRVRFTDGPEIEEYFAADTFALALKEFGLEKVQELGLIDNGAPLVGPNKHPTYQQRKFGNIYISTHSSTERKRDLVLEIAKLLKRKVTATIIQ